MGEWWKWRCELKICYSKHAMTLHAPIDKLQNLLRFMFFVEKINILMLKRSPFLRKLKRKANCYSITSRKRVMEKLLVRNHFRGDSSNPNTMRKMLFNNSQALALAT
ncbi:CLUMA_CG019332, isoform A [Clunio marinus]|uniref:CLUMA_CG019332, isoform A n=1 Tax=Clunio marinus TaxID=568069 RepID=A0A1J1J114_9DIPT|nr:CLUMA_CG019332, isoform A [Clunio marinus]